MHYAIDYHSLSLNLKENPVMADSKAKLRSEVR
jgi:hypothetical protein